MSIIVQNVSKKYDHLQALDNISFQVKKGEIVGFLGPNGAGKSTLMKILTTYISADEGEVKINGYDVNTQAKEVQKSIGYLPEHNPLYLDLYVIEYLQFNAGIYKVTKARVNEIIQQVGLVDYVYKKISQLSKGYRQRVGLATAMLHNPDVLILDEPTTGLDPNQIVEIRELIKNIGKEKIVFFSTHIMQEVEALCDRVIILKEGKIVADKKLNEMMGEFQYLEIEFDFKIEEEFMYKIPHLKTCKNIHDTIWELTLDIDAPSLPILQKFAQEMGLQIIKYRTINKDLEHIFREKTI